MDSIYIKKRRLAAFNDIEAVSSADMLVVVMRDPTWNYYSVCMEIGVAVGLKIPVVFLTPWGDPRDETTTTSVEIPFQNGYSLVGTHYVNSLKQLDDVMKQ
jgi:hypothetical protein